MPPSDIHLRPTRVVRTPNRPVIGGYEVSDVLHESAASTIYRARYAPRDEPVAMKVLNPALARDPAQIARFRREARCLYRMRGVNTVRLYDHGTTDCGTYYLAMELLDGERLDRYQEQRGGGLHWREALHVLRALAVALAEAHGQGIVHRGIRPSHIVIGASGTVTLIDFGLARFRAADPEDDPSSPEHGMGAPLRYIAPQQRAGAQWDPASDRYALAAMTLELLLGTELQATGPVVIPRTVPREIERLLLRCLSPGEHATSAADLVTEIDQLCAISSRRVLAHTPAFELEPPRLPRLT